MLNNKHIFFYVVFFYINKWIQYGKKYYHLLKIRKNVLFDVCQDKGTQSSKNVHVCFKQGHMIIILLEVIKYYTIQ